MIMCQITYIKSLKQALTRAKLNNAKTGPDSIRASLFDVHFRPVRRLKAPLAALPSPSSP